MPLAGALASGGGKIIATSAGYNFCLNGMTTAQERAALAQALPERCAQAISGIGEQRDLQGRGIPHAARDEVVQPVIADIGIARRVRLHALTVTRTNQPDDIGRTHPTSGLVR